MPSYNFFLFRFAQDVLSTSPGDRRSSTERLLRPPSQISPRDSTHPVLKPGRPDLAKLSIVSPTKYGSSSVSTRDPRLKSPSLKSPSLKSPSLPGTPVSASFVKQRISPTVPALHRTLPSPDQVPGSLMVKVNSHVEVKPKDPRLMTGLLAVAVPSGVPASPASPSPKSVQRPPQPKTEEPKAVTKNLDERIKSLNEQYEKWSGSVRVAGPGRSDGSRNFNIDIKPNQPSAIVQKLLSRKSVFDDDSKRLETRENEKETPSEDKPENSPGSGGFNTLGFKQSPVAPLKHGGDSPLLNLDSPLFSPVNQFSRFPALPPRDTPPLPVVPAVMSPVPASTSSQGPGPTKPLPSPLLSRSPAPQSPSTPASPRGPSLSNRLYFPPPPSPLPGQVKPLDLPSRPVGEDLKQLTGRPLPLPNKAGTAATSATVPIKPLVDRLGKPAAFTKPSATVTPTLKSTGMTASTARSTLSTVGSTKTISTCTMAPSAKTPTQVIIPCVEKGEASSTTCSPKLDSTNPGNQTESISTVQETDSDPNVTSTTKDPSIEAKKKLDTAISRDPIKSIKKEIESLSFREKRDIKEELLFAPTLIQTKPKIDKLNKKFDILDTISKDVKKSKDGLLFNKDKLKSSKDSQKHKQKLKHKNELKDFLTATATIRKETSKKEEKKPVSVDKEESKKPDETKEKKRRLSSNSEVEELEPKSKQIKLKVELDTELDAKKQRSDPVGKLSMGRIPKLEKSDKSEPKKDEKSKDSKHKHISSSSSSSSSKSKSKHDSERPEKHRHKSERKEDREKDLDREKAKKKKSSKHDEEKVRRHEKSLSLSTDDEKMKRDKELKKMKESRRDKEKDRKDSDKDRDRKDSEKDKDRSEKEKDRSEKDKDRSEKDKERRDKDKEHKSKENKDRNRDKDRDRDRDKDRIKDKERERERRERKRKKEEERKKSKEEHAKKKRKFDHESSSDEGGTSDDSKPKFSIFDEPIFDVNNPIYFSMYDKVSLL